MLSTLSLQRVSLAFTAVAALAQATAAYGQPGGDCREWSQVGYPPPVARARHAMAYDSVRGVTVLHGGEVWPSSSNETWEWNGTDWLLVSTSGPGRRAEHAMAFDSRRGVTVLFGGYGNGTRGDTWEWDGVTWTLMAQSGPGPRSGHAMAYDTERGVTVLFGGSALAGR